MSVELKNKIPFLILVGLFLIPAVWALFVPGYYGASDDIHIAWLQQFHKTLMMGQIPPRFVPDLSYGFGYPLFNFVFPLPFYLSEIFHLLGFSFVDSIKALFFITIPLSGFFMYLLLREYTNKTSSLLGMLLYIYTPYRSVDLYVRGAIGEITGFVLLPLILLSVIKLSRAKNLKWVGIGAIALASLVLSHNITAYMFFPFMGVFFLIQMLFSNCKKQFVTKTILMTFLALLISLYFWLPAIVDSKLMKYDTVFNFVDHFPTLRQLVTPFWGYGASVAGPYDGMSFFLGITNLFILILGIFLLISKWSKISTDKKIILSWVIIVLLSAVFLMNFRSSFLWSNLPLLPYFQFPWRFLILTTFVIPIFVIILDEILFFRFFVYVLIGATLITTGTYFRPQDFLGRKDDYFLNRYIPSPQASDEYKKTQEEYLRLPKDTLQRPVSTYPRATDGMGIKNILELNALDAIVTVESGKPISINYNKYYFPGWQVKRLGKSVEIKPGVPFGQISIDLPAGYHKLEVKFEETAFKKILDAISLIAFLVSLMLAKLWIPRKLHGRFW